MSEEISPELRQFTLDAIESVEQILILQTLAENPARVWSVADLTRELRCAELAIERRLQGLYRSKVLTRGNGEGHRFLPPDAATADRIAQLLRAFRERPNRVVELIYDRPATAIQAFAEAFRFRKGDNE